jgi:lipopolysaccharide/colanic/teichoic acid biosynthesis glycosyltransferase
MSLVGPRPEVALYVAQYPEQSRETILSLRPGITDLASIEFRDEEVVLATAADREKAYVEEILPRKLVLCETYVANRSFFGDLAILAKTFFVIVR